MSPFKYETHLHTREASACAEAAAAEQARFYKSAGYDGIIVTDHFFNGNSAVPRDLPWEERIDLFCMGYENAKAEGDKIGLKVFFGWESGYKGPDFLVYGLDKQWLKNHPDMLSWSVEEQYERVHKDGGFIVHAHPFRVRPYIKEVRLYPDSIDAVEIINVGNRNDEFDRQAAVYAEKLKLPVTAGTDAHWLDTAHTGLGFYHRIESICDFIESIKSGEYEIIKP